MILKLSSSIKKLQWRVRGEAQKAQGGSSHLTYKAAVPRQIRAHWQRTGAISLSVPAPWLGMDFAHWGDLFVNQGPPLWVYRLVFHMLRHSPVCLEQGPLQDTVFVFSKNKVNCVVAFCVIFFHVTKGNQWAFAAFQDFMLILHCYQYFLFFFFRKENYLNCHEVTNPQSCNHCRHNASYLPNMNNSVHLFTWSFELL